MWSEQVQGAAVEGKLWPRVAALGERLWADPETGNQYATQLNTIAKRSHRNKNFNDLETRNLKAIK